MIIQRCSVDHCWQRAVFGAVAFAGDSAIALNGVACIKHARRETVAALLADLAANFECRPAEVVIDWRPLADGGQA